MLAATSKAFFHLLARSRTLKHVASRYGLRPNGLARRFVAGETVDEAIEAVRSLEEQGLLHTLDHLGEFVTSLDEADRATRELLELIDAVVTAGVGRNLSIKLTQLGLDVDKASAVDNLRKILERAEPQGFFVRIDMESSSYTDVTLEIFETLWRQGHRRLGVVLQAALRRSEQDLQRILALGGPVRLVKGAYREPAAVAYPRKADVDAAYARMMHTLSREGHHPAFATHDPALIELACDTATRQGLAKDAFEFQMLYGIRRDLQAQLVARGYQVRVYVPFGREWFPYFMRRLGERPANIAWVVRGIRRDRT